VEVHNKAAVRAATKRSKGPIGSNFATGKERCYSVCAAGPLLAFQTVTQGNLCGLTGAVHAKLSTCAALITTVCPPESRCPVTETPRQAFPLDRNIALPDRDPHDPSVRRPVFLVWLRYQPGGGRDARDLTYPREHRVPQPPAHLAAFLMPPVWRNPRRRPHRANAHRRPPHPRASRTQFPR
jgi:hypothetical protein